jgi:hypothetical protein
MPTESLPLPARVVVRFANSTEVVSPFEGSAVQWATAPGGLRASRLPAEEEPPWLIAALTDPDLSIREQETIQVDVSSPARDVGRLRAAPQEDVVVLRPKAAPPGSVQAVLYQDESGGMSWHFPDSFVENAAAALGHGDDAETRTARLRLREIGKRSFTISARTAAAQAAFRSGPPTSPRLRSGASKLGRKIFRVLLLPILEHLIEKPVGAIVGKIESKHRQTLIRPLTPDNYKTRVETPFTDWASLQGKRSLLVIHGIFSTTEGVLSLLKQQPVERWKEHYGGRMIAYDHLTVTQSPEDNARFFLEELARAGGPFEFDILCHSRGGIVARTLAERWPSLVPEARCDIRNIFFVATPNQGSQIGDADHMVEMLDVFTNLVNLLPNGPVLYSIEILLAIVKLLAFAFEQLPGVVSMGTKGYIPDTLNRATSKSPAAYAAAAANYEPKPGDLLFSLADSVLDRVFENGGRQILNDLVVPTEGVFAANSHPSFPIENPLVYSPGEALWHTELFGQDRTVARIERHFGIEGSVTSAAAVVPEAIPRRRPGLRGPVRGGFTKGMPLPVDRESSSASPAFGRAGNFAPSSVSESAPMREPAAPSPASASASEPVKEIVSAEELRRDPFLDFHELVQEGTEQELVVRLEEVPDGRDALLSIGLPASQESVDVTVTLSAPGFDVAPGREQKLTVTRRRNPESEKAVFRLTARHPGPAPVSREIRADFWLGNGCIGSVTHRTTVAPKGYTGPLSGDGGTTSSPFAVPRIPRRDCDLIIRVEGRDDSGKPPFSIRLRSEILGHEIDGLYVGELELAGNELSLFFNHFLDGQFQRYPGGQMSDADFDVAYERWRAGFSDALDDFGRSLWTMLPQAFRDKYFEYYQDGVSPRSILVHSDETIFPWELVVPHATIGGKLVVLKPLGVAHVLGRWRPGLRMMPNPQSLMVRGFCVLNPTYPPPNDLPWSIDEVTRLRKIFPGLIVVAPADQDHVRREVLQKSDIQILHFSGHGDYDSTFADLNSIALEDGPLEAFRFQGTPLGAEAHPILYLNACSAGKAGLVVGRMGGFAANCLTSGCSGIIAPYWPINDDRASDFSCALYTKLNQGRAVGEALQELRQENPRDPTFRAYAYFGDPWTQPVFPL